MQPLHMFIPALEMFTLALERQYWHFFHFQVEKALQRISIGASNPMFTSEQSVRNKAGPEVRGCIELLLALGFERGDAKDGRLTTSNDALYFPMTDTNGLLAGGSGVIQALLGKEEVLFFSYEHEIC